MGNGAPVGSSSSPSKLFNTFASVENLVERGYFLNNFEAYKAAVEETIKNEVLDALEILLPAGDCRKVLPLHIAASMAKLECCELLLSAGFSPYSTDIDGYTPLHLCATNASDDAGLCSTLLSIAGPRAINMRDKSGCMPLHIAIESGSESVIRALGSVKGVKFDIPNGRGRTPKELAEVLGRDYIIEALAEVSGKKKSVVDTERIMQVWEKFFENALKAFDEDAEKTGGLLTVDDGGFSRAKQSIYNSDYHSYWESCREEEVATHATSNAVTSAAVINPTSSPTDYSQNLDYRVWDWFCWICCYAAVDDGFYTVNSYDGRSLWLEEFLSLMKESGLCPGEWDSLNQREELLVRPTSCVAAIDTGWITYFDENCNDCYWYQIPTGDCERCLQLGWDTSNSQLGMQEYEGSWEWLQCPNSYECVHSWVVVLLSTHTPYAGEEEYTEFNLYSKSCDVKVASYSCSKASAKEGKDGDGLNNGGKADAQLRLSSDQSSQSSSHEDKSDSRDSIKASEAKDLSDSDEKANAHYCHHDGAIDDEGECMELSVDDENARSREGVTHYYLNRMTGHSSWYPPEGWDAMVADIWCGWVLCMSEDSDWALFWWNSDTGESLWVEECGA